MTTRARGIVAAWMALWAAQGVVVPGAAFAAPAGLEALEASDREALETLATHPEPLREAALRAARHPDVLVETQRIQEQSSADFQERVDGLDRAQQEMLWELVREPGLLQALAGQGPRSAAQLDALAARHPATLAAAIRELGAHHATLLEDALAIQSRADARFQVLLEGLPDDPARQAFRDLLEEPELLSLLARRVRLAVRLGESYRDDPEATRRHLASLAAELAERDVRARDDWVGSMADDPDTVRELEASARVYAEENGYDYHALTAPDVRTRVEIVVHPYPFWFGYPLWYADLHHFPYGYWTPRPAHFGFSIHRGGHTVWFGLPSLPFLSWYFGGHHHHRYARLSHGFDSHHRRHRHARSAFHTTLGNSLRWRNHRHGFPGRRDPPGDPRLRRGHRGDRAGAASVSLFESGRFLRDRDRDRVRQGAGRDPAPRMRRLEARGREPRRGAERHDRVLPGRTRGGEAPRVARPSRQPSPPRAQLRSVRPDSRADRDGISPQRRDRGPSRQGHDSRFSSRGRDRGPSLHRGPRGGGPRNGHRGGHGGNGRGRGGRR